MAIFKINGQQVKAKSVQDAINSYKDSKESDIKVFEQLEKTLDEFKKLDTKYAKLVEMENKYWNSWDGYRSAVNSGKITKEKLEVFRNQLVAANKEFMKVAEKWNKLCDLTERRKTMFQHGAAVDLKLNLDSLSFPESHYYGKDAYNKLKYRLDKVKAHNMKEYGTGSKNWDSKANDFFEPVTSFKSWQFKDKTKQGFQVIQLFEDLNDHRLHALVKRGANDYIVALGYSPDDGTWNQGRYDYTSLSSAIRALHSEKKVKAYDSVKDSPSRVVFQKVSSNIDKLGNAIALLMQTLRNEHNEEGLKAAKTLHDMWSKLFQEADMIVSSFITDSVEDTPRAGTVKQSKHIALVREYGKKILAGNKDYANIDSLFSELQSLYEDLMYDYKNLPDDFHSELKENYKSIYNFCKDLQKKVDNDYLDRFILQYEDKLKHLS